MRHLFCNFTHFSLSKVNDIHAVLEVIVLDEDKNKVYEFLGRIEIPILTVSFFLLINLPKSYLICLISTMFRYKMENENCMH